MENLDWFLQESQKLADQSKHFTDKALFTELQTAARELDQRIQQVGGEIDGRTWNTGKW
ncbi:hypothetical protein LOSG293_260210 [Secundilactobacillus oryzae JCM 18671]|uniref:Uncharacterized protein n=1 Tax=Secundilactobacillus oryzae JCM 18671 TaxID=1291743 RepID=A0A081BJZ0_9LACO|nr:hypothetical protein [Secundilactobacillus oryzae]GAK48358.1 hypothetical protein LOSG293_260210 [Secundilactobacillus oryzae JCM 18671]